MNGEYLKDALFKEPFFGAAVEDGGAVVVESVNELEAQIERLLTDHAYRDSVVSRARA